jgi:hypothetical protein
MNTQNPQPAASPVAQVSGLSLSPPRPAPLAPWPLFPWSLQPATDNPQPTTVPEVGQASGLSSSRTRPACAPEPTTHTPQPTTVPEVGQASGLSSFPHASRLCPGTDNPQPTTSSSQPTTDNLQPPSPLAPDWPSRQQELREAEWDLHKRLLRNSIKALDAQQNNPSKGSSAEIERLAELASALGRRACGMDDPVSAIPPVPYDYLAEVDRIYGQLDAAEQKSKAEGENSPK